MKLVLILGAFLYGCGGSGGSCDQRSGNHLCQEYDASSDVLATYKTGCIGIWKDGPCDRTASVGGCKTVTPTTGITITTWYYPPSMMSDVQTTCMSPNTFVSP
jgi:hypothetical protein